MTTEAAPSHIQCPPFPLQLAVLEDKLAKTAPQDNDELELLGDHHRYVQAEHNPERSLLEFAARPLLDEDTSAGAARRRRAYQIGVMIGARTLRFMEHQNPDMLLVPDDLRATSPAIEHIAEQHGRERFPVAQFFGRTAETAHGPVSIDVSDDEVHGMFMRVLERPWLREHRNIVTGEERNDWLRIGTGDALAECALRQSGLTCELRTEALVLA